MAKSNGYDRVGLEAVEGDVWCDVHGCIHAESNDPYEYAYAATGEEPECGPKDWRKLWIGARYSEKGQEDG